MMAETEKLDGHLKGLGASFRHYHVRVVRRIMQNAGDFCLSGDTKMSGGGGGGSTRPEAVTPIAPRPGGGGAGGMGGPDPCALIEDTILNSPVPAVVATLKVGDILDVSLVKGPPVRVIVQTLAGVTAGSFTGAKLPQIIKCLEAGVVYQALVVSIKGAAVRIRVSNK